VSGLLVPLAVVVVGHHVDPVQVAAQRRYVVPNIHYFLARTDRSRQKEAARLERLAELPHPGGESRLVLVVLLPALSLPATRVLPVKVQPIEVVLLDKLYCVGDELFPSFWVVDQLAVLAALAVIPATQGEGYLDPVFLEGRHLSVHVLAGIAVGHVSIGVV